MANAIDDRVRDRAVEEKVGIGDSDGLASGVERNEERVVDRIAAALGRTPYDLDGYGSAWRLRPRKVRVAAEGIPRGFQPILNECRLHPLHGGPLDAHVGVPPVVGCTAIAHPFAADTRTAGEADPTVDDEDATVVAVVRAPQRPR